ncbi:MAG TPA: hypothetical protein PLA08_03315 [Candidatus Cloacimonadota bacterium]|nr:hypothetical protein [Candidatus Cloacimonadota bacterium]
MLKDKKEQSMKDTSPSTRQKSTTESKPLKPAGTFDGAWFLERGNDGLARKGIISKDWRNDPKHKGVKFHKKKFEG